MALTAGDHRAHPCAGRATSTRALASIAEQAPDAGVERRRRGRRPGRADARGGRAHGRALRRPRAHARAERRAQHGASTATDADWLFFVDDDVEVRPGWLAALLAAARGCGRRRRRAGGRDPRAHRRPALPPVRARGRADHVPRSARGPRRRARLGREHGVRRACARARRAVRREPRALRRRAGVAGPRLRGRRPDRLGAAAPALDHVRAGATRRVRALARAAYARGQASRRYDVFKGRAPSLGAELRAAGAAPRCTARCTAAPTAR